MSSSAVGWIVLGGVLVVAIPVAAPYLPEHAGGAILGALFAAAAVLLLLAGLGQFARGRTAVGAGLLLGAAALGVLFWVVGLESLQALISRPG